MLNLSQFRKTLDDIGYGLIAVDRENLELLEQAWNGIRYKAPDYFRSVIDDRLSLAKTKAPEPNQ